MDPEIRYLIFEFFDNPIEFGNEIQYVCGTIDRSIYTVALISGKYIITKGGSLVLSGNNTDEILTTLRRVISEK